MKKPYISIIIPAIPGRIQRLKAILTRLNLSASLSLDIPFEIVIADGGSTDDTKEMIEKWAEFMPVKYIWLPIGKFINAAYPRNVALRVCEGEIIGHLDIDHWPSENTIMGMCDPFLKGQDKIINRGYVIDSSKSEYCKVNGIEFADNINAPLLSSNGLEKVILDVYKYTKIPPPGINNTLWIWAVKRKYIMEMNAYDEIYCKAYCREDDDFRERLLAKGLSFYDGQNQNFCAIHLWHPAAWRTAKETEINKKYFQEMCCPVKKIIRNEGQDWGKMLEGSFSIIDAQMRNPKAHEEWIKENIKDICSYEENPTRERFKNE